MAKDKMKDPVVALTFLTPESRRERLAVFTLRAAIAFYDLERQSATPCNMKLMRSQHVIPNRDALAKILRYETTIERSLDRALNRLDRLQRRRKGESVLPP